MNSTPALILALALICMIGSSVSYTKSRRNKKGRVMRMNDVRVKIGGPLEATAASLLAALDGAVAGVAGSG